MKIACFCISCTQCTYKINSSVSTHHHVLPYIYIYLHVHISMVHLPVYTSICSPSTSSHHDQSMCYQLPALLHESGITLVISPLLSLIHDQVLALRALGVAAEALTGVQEKGDTNRVMKLLDDVAAGGQGGGGQGGGGIKLLYGVCFLYWWLMWDACGCVVVRCVMCALYSVACSDTHACHNC